MKCGSFLGLLYKGTFFSILLFLCSFAYSQPKILICQDIDISSTATEGFARSRSPDKEVVYFKSSNLKECLEQIENGDEVYINAHGGPGFFRWHGTYYSGFGNGTGQVPLPDNFADLEDVNIHLVMCYSGSGNPSVADTLSVANENIVVESYSGICYTDIQIDLGLIDLNLHQTVQRVNNAYWELYLQQAIPPTVSSIDDEKFHNVVEQIIQHVKNQYPDFEMNRLFVDLLLAIELLEDWHSLPPINKPNEEYNHETFIRELFSLMGFPEIGKHARVVGYYMKDVHKTQKKLYINQQEENVSSFCEECQGDCGGDISTIYSNPLAVQLISFTTEQIEDGIKLNWETDETLAAVNIWRAQQDKEGNYFNITKLNNKVIYNNTFTDNTAQMDIEFFYGLETINHAGLTNLDVGSVISTTRK